MKKIRKYCDKLIKFRTIAMNGQTFFEHCEVRCGWKKGDGSKYQCDKCKLTPHKTDKEVIRI